MSKQSNTKRNIKVRKDTQVIDVMDYPSDPKALKIELEKRVLIDPAKIQEMKDDDGPAINIVRKSLGFLHKDGSETSLIIKFDRLYSYGVQENREKKSKELTGYSIGLSMYDMDGASERQLRTVTFMKVLAEIVKEHLLQDETKEEMQTYDLEAAHLKNLLPLVYKKDAKKKIIEDSTPTFYPKLIWYKERADKDGKIKPANMVTQFYDEEDVDAEGEQLAVNPLDFIGKHCFVTAAIKFDGVFMNSVAKNIQVKLVEAEVKLKDNTKNRLLRPSSKRQAIISSSSSSSSSSSVVQQEEFPEEEVNIPVPVSSKSPVAPSSSSKVIVASDDEAPPEEEPVEEVKPKKKVVRKVKASDNKQ
jgi:hypothetical protein